MYSRFRSAIPLVLWSMSTALRVVRDDFSDAVLNEGACGSLAALWLSTTASLRSVISVRARMKLLFPSGDPAYSQTTVTKQNPQTHLIGSGTLAATSFNSLETCTPRSSCFSTRLKLARFTEIYEESSTCRRRKKHHFSMSQQLADGTTRTVSFHQQPWVLLQARFQETS